MAETPLDKVLRLAGGVTKGYTHQVNGRPILVRSYPTPHPSAAQQPVPTGKPAPAAAKQQAGTAQFAALKVGQVVQIQNQDYKVKQVNVPFTPPQKTSSGVNTGSKGTNVNAAANTAAGAAAQAVAARSGFGTPAQNPQLAALNGKTIPSGTPTVTNELVSQANGWAWFVTLPAAFSIKVVSA